ncbi:MAG: hypothetical protein CMG78_12125 [Marinobacter sp.]|nr:hypothetical protein [Marinobacter sp.]
MQATEGQVLAVPTPAPAGRWFPIGHNVMVSTVGRALENRGIEIASKRYDLLQDGEQFFAQYDVQGYEDDSVPGGLQFQIGMRGSINKTLSEALVFGTKVMVCSNGMLAGEYLLRRKNTTTIMDDIWNLINEGIDMFTTFRTNQTDQYHRLADATLTDRDAHDFVCRALLAEQAVTTNAEAVHALKEWHDPSHDEFKPRTAWSLHNAFTEASKDSVDRQPVLASRRHLNLNRMFLDEFALAA